MAGYCHLVVEEYGLMKYCPDGGRFGVLQAIKSEMLIASAAWLLLS